jgi:hypothetical protein
MPAPARPTVLGSVGKRIKAICFIVVMLLVLALWFLADQQRARVTTQDQCYIATRDPSCFSLAGR